MIIIIDYVSVSFKTSNGWALFTRRQGTTSNHGELPLKIQLHIAQHITEKKKKTTTATTKSKALDIMGSIKSGLRNGSVKPLSVELL